MISGVRFFECLKFYNKREELARRHEFLVEKSPPSPIALAQILDKIKAKGSLDVVVLVRFEDLKDKGEAKHMVIKALLEHDYRVITNDQSKYQFVVVGKLLSKQEHLNVKGFERHKFILQVVSQRESGAKLGALEFSTTQTGRNFDQAYEQALPKITNYINEHLSELYID